MRAWFRDWLIGFVLRYIAIGGNCGCCGAWVNNKLVASHWRITLCDKCIKGE